MVCGGGLYVQVCKNTELTQKKGCERNFKIVVLKLSLDMLVHWIQVQFGFSDTLSDITSICYTY